MIRDSHDVNISNAQRAQNAASAVRIFSCGFTPTGTTIPPYTAR